MNQSSRNDTGATYCLKQSMIGCICVFGLYFLTVSLPQFPISQSIACSSSGHTTERSSSSRLPSSEGKEGLDPTRQKTTFESMVPSSEPLATEEIVKDVGRVAAGIAKGFHFNIRLKNPLDEYEVRSTCGCLQVTLEREDATHYAVSGTLIPNAELGEQSREIGIYEKLVSEEGKPVQARPRVVVRVQFHVVNAYSLPINRFRLESAMTKESQATEIEIPIYEDLYEFDSLVQPPRVVGPLATESIWEDKKLRVKIALTSETAEISPHFVVLSIRDHGMIHELSIPVQITRTVPFSTGNKTIHFTRRTSDSHEAVVWFKGAVETPNSVTVSLWRKDSNGALLKLIDIPDCKVSAMGNIVKRFHIPSELINDLPKNSSIPLIATVQQHRCEMNCEIND